MNDQPKLSVEEAIATYIGLHKLLTGETLTSLDITSDIYTQYVQVVQHGADLHNLNLGFKDGKVMFSGVELIKKVKIIK
jgi:hypothetical protein